MRLIKLRLRLKPLETNFGVFINGDEKPVITANDSEYKTGSIGIKACKALATLDNTEINVL